MGCRASRDCSTDVDRGAQTCGPAVGTWPAANCNPAKVLFGSEVTEGTDLDTGVFRKESGLSPGAKAAACGTGAVVDARSSAAPARQQAWSPVTEIVAPDVVGVGVGGVWRPEMGRWEYCRRITRFRRQGTGSA